jgi:Tfp pilus assembly protein PilN
MNLLDIRECAALTWTSAGACRGVLIKRTRGERTVLRQWSGTAEQPAEIASVLVDGLSALAASHGTLIVLGGDAAAAGYADVTMPAVSSRDLRNALRYELERNAPVSADGLAWGYRVLDRTENRISVRLCYLREQEWRLWLDVAGSLGCGVDAVLPAAAALDPVLANRPVALQPAAEDQNAAVWVAMPSTGGREMLLAGEHRDECFGSVPEPLAEAGLNLGPLAALTGEEQQSFSQAVILGLYGLSGKLRSDASTWLALPDWMRPVRHRASRRLAAGLSIYLAAALTAGAATAWHRASSRLHSIQQRITSAEMRLDELTAGSESADILLSLGEEFEALAPHRPRLAEVLVQLTALLPESVWVSSFNWQQGRIDIEVRSGKDDLEFLQVLEESGLFRDIVPVRKTVGADGELTLRVQMQAAEAGWTGIGP